MTVHTCAHSKMPQHNIVNNVKLFSHELVSGHQYVHRQYTIDTTVPLPHGVLHRFWKLFNTWYASIHNGNLKAT